MTKLEYLLIAALLSIGIVAGALPLQQRLVMAVNRVTVALHPVVEACEPPFCVLPAAGPDRP